MRDVKILAFGHRSGVGKDTAVTMVKGKIELQVETARYAFADRLKLECYSLFGTLPPGAYEQDRSLRSKKIEGLDMNAVELWVKYGEAMRTVDPLIWVKCCLQDIECDMRHGGLKVALISDLRHENEARWLKNVGATLIKIESDVPKLEEAEVDDRLADYDGWDHEIFAKQGDLETLEAGVNRILTLEGMR